MKKYLIILGGLLAAWFIYVWGSYHFFYKNPTMEEIQQNFAKDHLKAPELDSIKMRGYSIKFLTNNLNDNEKGDELGYKKPYLILLHDSGKNSTYFLDYFKNKELNKKLHIIAVDRPGFGKSTFIKPDPDNRDDFNYREKEEFGDKMDVVTRMLVHEILDNEGHHLEEVRIISEGNAALAGLLGYQNEYIGFSKLMMMNGKFSERFFLSRWFSKAVSAFSFLFPRAYVSKQKDLKFIDKFKSKEEFDNLIDLGVHAKNREDESEGYIYRSENTEFQSMFFHGISKGDEKRIKKVVDPKYYIYENEGFDVYKNPDKLLEKIKEGNRYMMSIHWIDVEK